MAIYNDGEIEINSLKYKLASPLIESYLSPMPGKVNIGSDSFSKENYLSNWIQKDRRCGILINEMDESIHADRPWWTNCIISHDGHLTLPRKATKIAALSTTPPAPSAIVNPSMEIATGSGWVNGAGTWVRTDTYAKDLTYSYGIESSAGQAGDNMYQDLTGFVPGVTYTYTKWGTSTAGGAQWKIGVNDGVDTTFGTSVTTAVLGTFEQSSVAKTLSVAATRLRIIGQAVTANKSYYFDLAAITPSAVTVSAFTGMANFNGELYAAFGRCLAKLNAARDGWTLVAYFATSIVRLVPSLNNTLAIFLGDSNNYYSMATTELMTASNSSAAYYGVLNAGLLYKMNSTGTFASSNDPQSATPTWNNLADITTDNTKIEGLFRGRDADGNFVVYCAMNTTLMVYDATNDKWLPTELRLPDHPNGGKGAVYWNDGHYLSYGLGVKKYVTGSVASISEVGLDREGGLPIEYNGEIVKFCPDSSYFMAALVAASETSGNSQSGLYVWTGIAWECWWAGPRLLAEDCEDAWTAGANVTASKETTDFLFGTGSAKLVVADGASAGGLLASETITSTDFSSYDTMSLWIKSTVALTAGDLQFLMDDTASCASPIELIDIPAVVADTWTRVDCTLAAAASDTAIVSLGIKMVVDKGAFTINLERMEAVDYNATMTDIVVSSAESGYAIYWDCGGIIYYIDIPRGIQNVRQLSGTQAFEADGILLSPNFDAGTVAYSKLAQAITSYARSITTTETIAIRYRTNHLYEDRDSGWTTLVVLNSTAEAGDVETLLASGAGLSYDSIQYRLDLVRGSTTTLSPDLLALVTSYMLKITGNRAWRFTVNIDGSGAGHDGVRSQYDNIWTAVKLGTLVKLNFRNADVNEDHYVQLFLNSGDTKTGNFYGGQMSLDAVEV